MFNLHQLELAGKQRNGRAAPRPVPERPQVAVSAHACDVLQLVAASAGPGGEAGRVAGAVVADGKTARLVPVLVWRI